MSFNESVDELDLADGEREGARAALRRRLARVDWEMLASDGVVGVGALWALTLAGCLCWLVAG